MELTRCTLKKDGRKVVMQGMIHGISEPLLIWLNKDLKNQTRNGYRVFYEAVRIYEDDDKRANYSEEELEVHKFRMFSEGIKEEAMKKMDLAAQFARNEGENDGIKYPDNAINIDITYVDYIRRLTKLLGKEKIDFKKFFDIFNGVPRETIISGVVGITENLLSEKTTLKELDVTAMTLDFFRISSLVDMDYRNTVAARKINLLRKRQKINKIFVHYGESHIEGITDILVRKYGWRLMNTIKINSQNPTLRQKRI